jgi:hypothetical protein
VDEARDVAQQAEGDIDDGVGGADSRLDPDCVWRGLDQRSWFIEFVQFMSCVG